MGDAAVKGKRRWIAEARKDVPRVAHALAPYFAAHGWTWQNETRPPNATRIARTLHDLLDSLSNPGCRSTATGRLCVEAQQDGEYCVGVRMFAEIEP